MPALARPAALLAAGLLLLPLAARPAAGPVALPVTGAGDARLAPFDRLMTDFLKRHPALPGAALAVARDGRLVYARGFGHADPGRTRPVGPDALFRVASLSKPVTAVAVLRLAGRGQFRLDDPVFGLLGLEPPRGRGAVFDRRWRQVTVAQLLRHTGGWDGARSPDPMFRSPEVCAELGVPPPAAPGDVVRFMLARPLDFDPGSRYAYSNFGYCLLGRLVEKASGRPYEEYVRREVLGPAGAAGMRLGRTLPGGRFPGEVGYDAGGATGPAVTGPELGRLVPTPYGAWCLESLDSVGGWVASAADLARFASAFDRPGACGILGDEGVQTMFARPPGAAGFEGPRARDAYYACGWSVRPTDEGGRHAWHGGSLDGTSALLVRRADRLTWAVLFNSRAHPPGEGEPAAEIDPLVHRAAGAVAEWP